MERTELKQVHHSNEARSREKTVLRGSSLVLRRVHDPIVRESEEKATLPAKSSLARVSLLRKAIHAPSFALRSASCFSRFAFRSSSSSTCTAASSSSSTTLFLGFKTRVESRAVAQGEKFLIGVGRGSIVEFSVSWERGRDSGVGRMECLEGGRSLSSF